ncbi:MAG: LPXTG cell wall anchor domain-containing protein, partial [Anaerotignum sp.]|nr:LPXTG cell wall anchor domain-containing protein [Anaerotignum sp.]
TPSTDNGDDLVVSVVSGDKVIASGRVAGAETGDETHGTLTPDENGNYTFTNIIMTEGDHTYNITMEGIQNLKDSGVYLFTADVPAGTKPQPSMVGMTSDKNVVDVESLNFSFEVEDEKVVVREKHKPSYPEKGNNDVVTEDTVEEQEDIEENDVPLTDLPGFEVEEEPAVEDITIGDEEVPLADAPAAEDTDIADEEVPLADAEESIIAETGDSNHMTAGFAGMLAALAGLFGLRRKEN